MKKFVRIQFHTGHVYEVPASVIADDRTSYYAMQEPERTREQHSFETRELFKSDFNLFDWAKNNMNWSDLKKYARMVEFKAPDLQAAWDDAELVSTDEQRPFDIVSLGEDAVSAPLEMALAQVVASGEKACIFAFQQPDTKKTTSAVIAVVGDEDIVHGFVGVVAQFDDMLRKLAAGTTGH